MRTITPNELSRLTRKQLFALLVQVQAVLADLAPGTPEHGFCLSTLVNIRVALAKRPALTP